MSMGRKGVAMSADRYPKKEIDYVTKRSHQGASNEVIATELEYMCDVIRSADYVNGMRKELDLPEPNPELIKQHATTDVKKAAVASPVVIPPALSPKFRKNAGVSAEPALSVGAMNRAEKKHPETKKRASAETAPVEKAERKKITVDFKPAFVKACVVGETYVHAGIGPMICTEIKSDVVAGFKLEIASLQEIHTTGSPVTKKIMVSKFPAETIRKPVTPEIMDKILEKIELGLSGVKAVPKVSSRQPEFFDKYLLSPDIVEVADLLLYHYTDAKEISARSFVYGEKAMRLIAAEYATVTGTDYRQAMRLVSDKVGKTKPEEYVEPARFKPEP